MAGVGEFNSGIYTESEGGFDPEAVKQHLLENDTLAGFAPADGCAVTEFSEGNLGARCHRLQGGHGGHHGLARAHIPLHQAKHRQRLAQVLAYIGHHPCLGGGETER